MTGKEVLKVFNNYDVFNYLKSVYNVLHSTGQEYIVKDIDKYIKSRKTG